MKQPSKTITQPWGDIGQEDFELFSNIAQTQCKPFGYLDQYDVQNEVWVILLEVRETYKAKHGPKENYYRRCVKNRMANRYAEVTKIVRKPKEENVHYHVDNYELNQYFPEDRLRKEKIDFEHQNELQRRNDLTTPRELAKEQREIKSPQPLVVDQDKLEKFSAPSQFIVKKLLEGSKISFEEQFILNKEIQCHQAQP